MMGFRKDELDAAFRALQDFKQPLIIKKQVPCDVENVGLAECSITDYEYTVRAAGYTDDLGLYYLIPKLADFFGLTVVQGTTLFFYGIFLIGFILGLVGILFFFQDWLVKGAAAVIFIKFYTSVGIVIQDVYIVGFIVAISIIPLCLYFNRRNKLKLYALFLFFSGIVVALSFYIRAFSSVPVAMIVVWSLGFQSVYIRKQKLILLLSFFIGIVLIILHFNLLIAKRDAYLAEYHQHDTQTYMTDGHPLWHNVYLGLGYYDNPYNIEYLDHIADEKAKSIDPDIVYMSSEYDKLLRGIVIDFVKQNPKFVVKITLNKLLDIYYLLPLYLWVGIFFAVLSTRCLIYEAGILLALSIAILPGLLAYPKLDYISSFVGIMFIYAFVGYEQLLDRYFRWRIKELNVVT